MQSLSNRKLRYNMENFLEYAETYNGATIFLLRVV